MPTLPRPLKQLGVSEMTAFFRFRDQEIAAIQSGPKMYTLFTQFISVVYGTDEQLHDILQKYN
jgi:predicted 3-demethylubiquinone-9 3-methyltransferase (glyoxalase superfamily)